MASSFAYTQFGKAIDQIDRDDLLAYFSVERDESLTLEFKSFYQREGDIKHKENGVLRTICGFLNSNGGLLIWGAPIGSNNSVNQKVFTGDLSPVEKRYSKDDFISKISNRIVPFAAPVQIQSIEISQGKFAYVIDVPESESKPHQFDNTYYIRLDGQTKPAPHYIIDALFKQIKLPSLSGYSRVVGLEIGQFTSDLYSVKISLHLNVVIFNDSLNINDNGLYITLFTERARLKYLLDNGDLIGSNNNGFSNLTFHSDDSELKITEPDRVLTYALPKSYHVRLEVVFKDYKWLLDNRGGLKFSIVFGSTLSNTKISEYIVKLSDSFGASSDRAIKYTDVKSLNHHLQVAKQENKFVHDHYDFDEKTRTQFLRGI